MSLKEIQFLPLDSYKPGDVLISEEKIDARIQELARQIAADYQGKELLVVGLLKGGFMVTSDLGKDLYDEGLTDMSVSFMGMKSYFNNTTAVQEPVLLLDCDIDPKDRNVLLIDDIADTRRSLVAAYKRMRERGAASIATCVLLNKPDRKEVDFPLDYVGFTIPNIWVQGRGMDSKERGRASRRVLVGPYLG